MAKNHRIMRIRQRAYEIWENEGRPHGLDQSHWFRAEAEIGEDTRVRRSTKKPTKTTSSQIGKD